MLDGKTVIAIAHQLSTIAYMDQILMMNQGRTVEEGSYEQLLVKDELYAGFWAHQSDKFLDVDVAP